MIRKLAPLVFACAAVTSVSATADQLDTVIQRGTLNCGVVLDFPPMGYFDENNEPAGFDVDYVNIVEEGTMGPHDPQAPSRLIAAAKIEGAEESMEVDASTPQSS